jgi:aspartate-semialdehyde dehydrogenase
MMLRVLEERSFPVQRLLAVASERSEGRRVRFAGEEHPVLPVSASVFDGVDVALFSAGGDASRQWSPVAVEHGAVVIDNSSAWRMHDGVPLVVPEVNPHTIPDSAARIIANPNCSTIQMVVALRPLRDRYGLRRVFVSTYQAASGAGQRGLEQLDAELAGGTAERPAFAHTLLDNALPHIAPFLDNGSTVEEMKMVHETRKILELPSLPVSVTCVRVPVRNAHSEAVHAELNAEFSIDELRAVLAAGEGIVIEDDTSAARYPLAHDVAGRDEVYVGRIRRDTGMERGVAMWVVSDNVRKGAATNAVQIAELWQALRERGM